MTTYRILAAGFLVYALSRLAGAIPAFAQAIGWFDTQLGRDVVAVLAERLPALSERAIIPVPLAAYLGWSVLIGLVLAAGSVLALFRRRSGLALMGGYFVLYGLTFLNYLTLNLKFIPFAVGLALFGLMLRLKAPGEREAEAGRSGEGT